MDVSPEKGRDSSSSSSSTQAIQVAVRIRPLQDGSVPADESTLTASEGTIFVKPNKFDPYSHGNGTGRTFSFDHVLSPFDGQENTQEDVFRRIGAPLLDSALQSYNVCLLAYGQTGAGKSYSILGDPHSEDLSGLLPRACALLFDRLIEAQAQVSITASYLEIYNERMMDLLAEKAFSTKRRSSAFGGDHNPNERRSSAFGVDSADSPEPADKRKSIVGDLQVRMHPTLGCTIPGLTEAPVSSMQDVLRLCDKGEKHRKVGETYMNMASSRSHAIFILEFRMRCNAGTPGSQHSSFGGTKEFQAKVHFVDLAGSEKQRRTGAYGERLSEGIAINQSLTTLGRVILMLTSNNPKAVPPFRESKLTMLLKEALIGNSRTVLLACVSPAMIDLEESLSTLEFATRCKLVETKSFKNEQTPKSMDARAWQFSEERRQIEQMLLQERARNEELAEQLNLELVRAEEGERTTESLMQDKELIQERLQQLKQERDIWDQTWVDEQSELMQMRTELELSEEYRNAVEREWVERDIMEELRQQEHAQAVHRLNVLHLQGLENARAREEVLIREQSLHYEELVKMQASEGAAKEGCGRLLQERDELLKEWDRERKDHFESAREREKFQREQWERERELLVRVQDLQRQALLRIESQLEEAENSAAQERRLREGETEMYRNSELTAQEKVSSDEKRASEMAAELERHRERAMALRDDLEKLECLRQDEDSVRAQCDISVAEMQRAETRAEALLRERALLSKEVTQMKDAELSVKTECSRIIPERDEILSEWEQERKESAEAAREQRRVQKETWDRERELLMRVQDLQCQELERVQEQLREETERSRVEQEMLTAERERSLEEVRAAQILVRRHRRFPGDGDAVLKSLSKELEQLGLMQGDADLSDEDFDADEAPVSGVSSPLEGTPHRTGRRTQRRSSALQISGYADHSRNILHERQERRRTSAAAVNGPDGTRRPDSAIATPESLPAACQLQRN